MITYVPELNHHSYNKVEGLKAPLDPPRLTNFSAWAQACFKPLGGCGTSYTRIYSSGIASATYHGLSGLSNVNLRGAGELGEGLQRSLSTVPIHLPIIYHIQCRQPLNGEPVQWWTRLKLSNNTEHVVRSIRSGMETPMCGPRKVHQHPLILASFSGKLECRVVRENMHMVNYM